MTTTDNNSIQVIKALSGRPPQGMRYIDGWRRCVKCETISQFYRCPTCNNPTRGRSRNSRSRKKQYDVIQDMKRI